MRGKCNMKLCDLGAPDPLGETAQKTQQGSEPSAAREKFMHFRDILDTVINMSDEYDHYLMSIFVMLCIDATREDDTLGHLVNDEHKGPNCRMKKIIVQGKPHLCLFAIRDIMPGEEITYDYGGSDWPWRKKVC
ncbi:hypothetical protein P4O66_003972 [Electrophorus voltai]|uniref:SET domain-containing protein n=1 Tax=Electrophorus voltai TaxID=2609070 RepID=A0AAD8YQV9_9TELE|nr:hypothetical protein P4O66_003972 [Electrophorus voltai]